MQTLDELAREARVAARLYCHLARLPRPKQFSGLADSPNDTELVVKFWLDNDRTLEIKAMRIHPADLMRIQPVYRSDDAYDLRDGYPARAFVNAWGLVGLVHTHLDRSWHYAVNVNLYRDCKYWFTPAQIPQTALWRPDRLFMAEVIRLNLAGLYDA